MPTETLPAGGSARTLTDVVPYHHVDVFTDVAYAGNSLTVFVDPPPMSTEQMLKITTELRHFETIFIASTATEGAVDARVFDLVEELDFAGHPVLGAAGVLHRLSDAPQEGEREWTFRFPAKTVRVTTREHSAGHVAALLDQGRPELIHEPSASDRPAIAEAVGLTEADLHAEYPPEVISTGLRYLIVPLREQDALARARITHPDLDTFLGAFQAQYLYLLDPVAVEGRHWGNDGVVEDAATGSAAGCVATYLMRHRRAGHGEEVSLAQGRFVGRPSRIAITAYGKADDVERVTVAGDVAAVGTGALRVLPRLEGR